MDWPARFVGLGRINILHKTHSELELCTCTETPTHPSHARVMYRTIPQDDKEPQLRVQINQIDYTLEPSGELDSAESHSRVPVIRIYGASSFGETACVHVHQVYPYFFVEYLDELVHDHGMELPDHLITCLKCQNSRALRRNISTIIEPCPCAILKTESRLASFAVYSIHHTREGCTFLWISCEILTFPENLPCGPRGCQSCCCYHAVWNCHGYSLSHLRK